MLSVIIPVFNAEKTLGGLLDSIRNSSFNNYEIIAIDDCSTDSTTAVIKKYNTKSVFLSVRSGSAVARNEGAEVAQGQILVFLDADIEVAMDTLGRIAKKFQESPEIKVLVGTYDERPLNKGFFPRFKALWFASLFNHQSIYTDSLEGFCVAIDKRVFNSSGGFNSAFRSSSAEDYELGCRLRKKYKLYFDAKIKVRHHFPGFLKNAKCFFRRTYDFMPFFLKQDKEYRGSTFNRDGLVCIFASLSFIILPFALCGVRQAKFLFLLLFSAFIVIGLKFIRLAFIKEGLFFGIATVITYYINSLILSLAILMGAIRYFLHRRNYDIARLS